MRMKAILLCLTIGGFAITQHFVVGADPVQRGPSLDNVDKVTQSHSVRASKVVGMEVRNEKGEKLGKVHDLVLDTNSAKIRYAAISFGGVLGLGDKLFAVPWTSLDTRRGKDANDYYFVMAADPKMLKNSPGFDKDHWPDFGDSKYTSQIDKSFQVPVTR
jgi:sporulation protein YlmC with PRC-barrel domain